MEVICKNPECYGRKWVNVWDAANSDIECPFCGELMVLIESNQAKDQSHERLCKNCIFVNQLELGGYECRIKAPVLNLEYEGIDIGYWPRVQGTDWCGEFKKRSDINED